MEAHTGYLSIIFDHNVAVVSVSYPKDKRSYTVASTGSCKQIHSHVIPAHTHILESRNVLQQLINIINVLCVICYGCFSGPTNSLLYCLKMPCCYKKIISGERNSHLALILVLEPLMQRV